MKIILVALLVVLTFCLTGYATAIQFRTISEESNTISSEEAIEILEGSIRSHQWYLDRPHLMNSGTGNISFNQQCISDYQKVIDYIKGE